MCIFAGPVESVSATKIFVASDSHRQFTAYQMEWQPARYRSAFQLINGTPAPGNAMILPVRWYKGLDEIKLVDMSECKDFFDKMAMLQQRPRTRSMKGIPAMYGDAFLGHLEVHEVGDLKVSIAYSLEDINRVDPAVFAVSPDTDAVLTKHYSEGYAFIVVTLKAGGEVHPLGYISPLMDKLFIPTRHEHGDEGELPHWDHTIYVSSDKSIHNLTERNPWGSRPEDVTTRYTQGKVVDIGTRRVWDAVTSKVPELHSFANRAPTYSWLVNGKYKNTDLMVVL